MVGWRSTGGLSHARRPLRSDNRRTAFSTPTVCQCMDRPVPRSLRSATFLPTPPIQHLVSSFHLSRACALWRLTFSLRRPLISAASRSVRHDDARCVIQQPVRCSSLVAERWKGWVEGEERWKARGGGKALGLLLPSLPPVPPPTTCTRV